MGLYIKQIRPKDKYKGKVPEKITKAVYDITKREPFYKCILPAVDGNLLGYANLEISRGCHNSCRFCMASAVHKPYREHPLDSLKKAFLKAPKYLGSATITPYSLNYSTYSRKNELAKFLVENLNKSVITSTQRVDTFSDRLSEAFAKTGNRGATFAIEAGSQRMRNVINKEISEEQILHAIKTIIDQGYTELKLYMISNLPWETDEDRMAIVDLMRKVYEYKLEKGSNINIRISYTPFNAKPFTALQWADVTDKSDKLEKVYEKLTEMGIKYRKSISDINHILLQLLNRVDRRFCDALADMVINHNVIYMDSMMIKSDDPTGFINKFTKEYTGYEIQDYFKEIPLDKTLPWDILSTGVDKEWLKQEYLKAKEAAMTPSCFKKCSQCGVCTNPIIKKQGAGFPVYHLKNKDIPEEELIKAILSYKKKENIDKIACLFSVPPKDRFLIPNKRKLLIKAVFERAGLNVAERIDLLTDPLQFDNWTYGIELAIIRTNTPVKEVTDEIKQRIKEASNGIINIHDVFIFRSDELADIESIVDYVVYRTKMIYNNINDLINRVNIKDQVIQIRQKQRGEMRGRVEYVETDAYVYLAKMVKINDIAARVYLVLPSDINPYDTLQALTGIENKRELLKYPLERAALIKVPDAPSIFNKPCACGNLKETDVLEKPLSDKCLECMIKEGLI